MIIEYKNYFAEPDTVCPDRLNLFEKIETAKRPVLIGYGYTYPSLLKKLIALELHRRKGVITLKGYIIAWKEVQAEVLGVLESEM